MTLTSNVLTCGRFIGRDADGNLDSSHLQHGKHWFFDGTEAVCCAEGWRLGSRVRIQLSDQKMEEALPITGDELCGISDVTEKLYVKLTGDDRFENVERDTDFWFRVEAERA